MIRSNDEIIKDLLHILPQNRFETMKQISNRTGLPLNCVERLLMIIRNDKAYGYLCSKPGPRGGYRYDGSILTIEYMRMEDWVCNWRKSMGIEPLKSPKL